MTSNNTLYNSFTVFASRRRWLKRMVLGLLPKMASKRIFNRINFHYDPNDMRGPSFHFAYDLEKGFLNYEEVSKNELLELIPEKGCVLDVGANIGMFSVFFALKRDDISIYSFEPSMGVYSCLEKNMQQFKGRDIRVYRKGLGEVNEDKELYLSSSNDGGHSFIKDEQGHANQTCPSEVTSVLNFDEFSKKEGFRSPDVVKIDVEGFELDVLKGMKGTISSKKPAMLIESSNEDLANKGEFWQFISNFEKAGIYARVPGNPAKLSLDQLSNEAAKALAAGHPLSNYFYQFSS